MKILYIVNTYPDQNNPAAQPFVRAQIESVHKKGVHVDLVNVQGPQSKWNYLRAVSAVRRKLNNESYDIIHGHYAYSGWIAALQRRSPAVVSFMGSDLYGSPKKDGTLQIRGCIDVCLSKLLQYFVSGIIVKSKGMQQSLIKKQKSIVLPNGVDFELFRPLSQNTARKELNLDIEKKYILFAGSYKIPRKRFSIARNAVDILKAKDNSVELLVASGFPHGQVPLYMNAANVLVLPSIKEGSPNVVKEALACNLPVVATDVGDVKELIGNIPGCRVVDCTPRAFADAIQDVISRSEPFNGRKAIEHLRIEKVAEKLLDFYSIVIENWKRCRRA